MQCPVFGAFGGADNLVQADESMQAYLQHLNWEFGNQHALAVFPGANHGLFTADPDPAIPRTSQLAPGYLPDGGRIPGPDPGALHQFDAVGLTWGRNVRVSRSSRPHRAHSVRTTIC